MVGEGGEGFSRAKLEMNKQKQMKRRRKERKREAIAYFFFRSEVPHQIKMGRDFSHDIGS